MEPYVPAIKMCWNCLRYGHISNQCKGNRRCRQCGQKYHGDNVSCDLKCVHCDGKHLPNSKYCSEHNFQKDFRMYAAAHRLTFDEAKQVIRPSKHKNSSQTAQSQSLKPNFSNFPNLGDCQTTPNESILTNENSFAKSFGSRPPRTQNKKLLKSKSNSLNSIHTQKTSQKNSDAILNKHNLTLPSTLLDSSSVLLSSSEEDEILVTEINKSNDPTNNAATRLDFLIHSLSNFRETIHYNTSSKTEEVNNLLNNLTSNFTKLLNLFNKSQNG